MKSVAESQESRVASMADANVEKPGFEFETDVGRPRAFRPAGVDEAGYFNDLSEHVEVPMTLPPGHESPRRSGVDEVESLCRSGYWGQFPRWID